MNFQESLKAFRLRSGMTQQHLASQVGVRSETIGNWERGARQPSFEYLIKIASALGVSIDTLLGYIKPESAISAIDKKAEEIMRKYKLLDAHGKRAVEMICNIELERIRPIGSNVVAFPEAPAKRASGSHQKQERRKRYMPYYASPSAAGIAAPLEGNDFEMILVDDTVPDDADYAVRISGDSMEPYIEDGDMVYVKECADLSEGDVGIFCVDGAMYCKQYHVDDNGNLHLLSANPDREYCNIYVSCDSGSSVRCCGQVILDFPVPFPDYLQ